MSQRFRVLAVFIALATSLLAVAAVSAQTGPGSPQPVPPPPPPGGPGPSIRLDVTGFPFNFRFADRVFGFGFKPGERVTITVQKASAAPVTAVTDGEGSFEADIRFTWIFCGAHATQQPLPIIVATGNQGSTDHFTLYPSQCPTLIADEKLGNGQPPAGAPSTVTSGNGLAPAFPPQLATFDVTGFGFAPKEHATVREVPGRLPSSPSVQTAADAQGRLSFTIKGYVPGHCSQESAPMLAATGDAGTAVVVPLHWRDLIMSPCAAPPGTPSAPVTARPAAIAGPLSISLRPSVAQRGRMERAVIHGIGLRTVRLVVQYPGQGRMQRTVTADANGRAVLRWRVSSSAQPGTARARLTVQPGNVSLQAAFKVR